MDLFAHSYLYFLYFILKCRVVVIWYFLRDNVRGVTEWLRGWCCDSGGAADHHNNLSLCGKTDLLPSDVKCVLVQEFSSTHQKVKCTCMSMLSIYSRSVCKLFSELDAFSFKGIVWEFYVARTDRFPLFSVVMLSLCSVQTCEWYQSTR